MKERWPWAAAVLAVLPPPAGAEEAAREATRTIETAGDDALESRDSRPVPPPMPPLSPFDRPPFDLSPKPPTIPSRSLPGPAPGVDAGPESGRDARTESAPLASPQSPAPDCVQERVRDLERKLDRLAEEMRALRAELGRLRNVPQR